MCFSLKKFPIPSPLAYLMFHRIFVHLNLDNFNSQVLVSSPLALGFSNTTFTKYPEQFIYNRTLTTPSNCLKLSVYPPPHVRDSADLHEIQITFVLITVIFLIQALHFRTVRLLSTPHTPPSALRPFSGGPLTGMYRLMCSQI